MYDTREQREALLGQAFADIKTRFKPEETDDLTENEDKFSRAELRVNFQHVQEVFADQASAVTQALEAHKLKTSREYNMVLLKAAIRSADQEKIGTAIKWFSDNHCSMSRLEQENEFSLLRYAIEGESKQSVDTVRLLIKAGCLLNDEVFYSAAKYCKVDIVAFLYETMESPDLNNIRGIYNNETPLHGAIRKVEPVPMIPIFEDLHSEPKMRRPIFLVERQEERFGVIEFLVQNGASYDEVFDNNGKSPIALCNEEDGIKDRVLAIIDHYKASPTPDFDSADDLSDHHPESEEDEGLTMPGSRGAAAPKVERVFFRKPEPMSRPSHPPLRAASVAVDTKAKDTRSREKAVRERPPLPVEPIKDDSLWKEAAKGEKSSDEWKVYSDGKKIIKVNDSELYSRVMAYYQDENSYNKNTKTGKKLGENADGTPNATLQVISAIAVAENKKYLYP